ncbi:hypothetical protein AXG93_815s1470 [Marchantia polymorpha subsp. ruderalis]|uniref:Uncharacterized protein n=1 Tax=Marchantia polymorpha subsp. ruderalis TaxID=1480154 RepID=A0A176W089_MARPO|nr:hypothetical protein AXG93_815s1470 [Marchantia polymorpha subsp. ruderalis]
MRREHRQAAGEIRLETQTRRASSITTGQNHEHESNEGLGVGAAKRTENGVHPTARAATANRDRRLQPQVLSTAANSGTSSVPVETVENEAKHERCAACTHRGQARTVCGNKLRRAHAGRSAVGKWSTPRDYAHLGGGGRHLLPSAGTNQDPARGFADRPPRFQWMMRASWGFQVVEYATRKLIRPLSAAITKIKPCNAGSTLETAPRNAVTGGMAGHLKEQGKLEKLLRDFDSEGNSRILGEYGCSETDWARADE